MNSIAKFIKFLKEDFWNYMQSLPKCKKGGYCNQDREEYYVNDIKAGNRSTIVHGYKYYCNKCGNNTTEFGKF